MILPFILAVACGLHGDAKDARASALNVLKNRSSAPTAVDSSITFASMIKHGSDLKRFSSAQAATIAGVCIEVKDGGLESCNCHSATRKDTHVALAMSVGAPKTEWVIVEVTPRLRDRHPDWTTGNLKKRLLGHLVKVTGWMMADIEHTGNATNTNPRGKHDWRATVWEIHPATGIEVMQ